MSRRPKLTFEEPVIAMHNDHFSIDSEVVADSLSKKNLSPSLITSLEGCHARMLFESFVKRDLLKEEPDNEARRGNLFHKVMEDFFALAPEDRTQETLGEIRTRALSEGEFEDLGRIPEAVQWLDDAIEAYYAMGARPQTVRVANVPGEHGDEVPGREVFVKGRIGNASREILGFVDRIIEDTRTGQEGNVVIEDWKTGKVKRWNPKTKSTEGLSEARQQVIYTMLMRAKGVNVSAARLIYPVKQEIVRVDIDSDIFNERVVRDVETADTTLSSLNESNRFSYSPMTLCSWCPLANICPAAEKPRFDKARDAVAKQPKWPVLAKAIRVV